MGTGVKLEWIRAIKGTCHPISQCSCSLWHICTKVLPTLVSSMGLFSFKKAEILFGDILNFFPLDSHKVSSPVYFLCILIYGILSMAWFSYICELSSARFQACTRNQESYGLISILGFERRALTSENVASRDAWLEPFPWQIKVEKIRAWSWKVKIVFIQCS